MNDIKLKPFDLAAAQRGEPVIFRNGEPYKFGAYNPDASEGNEVAGWGEDGDCYNHSPRGFYTHPVDSDYDLFMKPQEKELWIAVSNKKIDGLFNTSHAYESESQATNWIGGRRCMFQIIKITIQQ